MMSLASLYIYRGIIKFILPGYSFDWESQQCSGLVVFLGERPQACYEDVAKPAYVV